DSAWNFALLSRSASAVTLLLYRRDDPATPVLAHRLDPVSNKTGPVWHCWMPAARAPGAELYAYRVDGAAGARFDPQKILLDPYAPAVYFPRDYGRAACSAPGPTDGRAPLGVLPTDETAFEWGTDRPAMHTHDLIVYEMHVKGFTAGASCGVSAE